MLIAIVILGGIVIVTCVLAVATCVVSMALKRKKSASRYLENGGMAPSAHVLGSFTAEGSFVVSEECDASESTGLQMMAHAVPFPADADFGMTPTPPPGNPPHLPDSYYKKSRVVPTASDLEDEYGPKEA